MTADAVTDEQLGKFYRKTRAISERLGKSISYPRLMDTLQAIHDGGAFTTDVRNRIRQTTTGCVVRGSYENDVTVEVLMSRVSALSVDVSVYDLFPDEMKKKARGVLCDRWRRFEVAVADTHQNLLRDLDISRWTSYAGDETYRLFVHLAEALRLQTTVCPLPGTTHDYFNLEQPNYLYLMKGETVFVAKLWQLKLMPGKFRLAIENEGTMAAEGATVYLRVD